MEKIFKLIKRIYYFPLALIIGVAVFLIGLSNLIYLRIKGAKNEEVYEFTGEFRNKAEEFKLTPIDKFFRIAINGSIYYILLT